MTPHTPCRLLALILTASGLVAAPLTLTVGEEPRAPAPVVEPSGEVAELRSRIQELERVVLGARAGPEAGAEAPLLDQISRARPQTAGPLRPRIVLDLDGNHRITDLGPRGSGKDGVLLLGFASVEESSPWEWLRAYDTNLDGRLDAADYEFRRLQIWVDADEDLVPRSREMHRPPELGVQSIQLPASNQGQGSYRSKAGQIHLAGIEKY